MKKKKKSCLNINKKHYKCLAIIDARAIHDSSKGRRKGDRRVIR